MKFLENIPSYLFFTGKGGVGKTSISCATAIRLAELGKRVLLVSTDPASNVGQVPGIRYYCLMLPGLITVRLPGRWGIKVILPLR